MLPVKGFADRLDDRTRPRVIDQHRHPGHPLQCRPVTSREMEAGKKKKKPGEERFHESDSLPRWWDLQGKSCDRVASARKTGLSAGPRKIRLPGSVDFNSMRTVHLAGRPCLSESGCEEKLPMQISLNSNAHLFLRPELRGRSGPFRSLFRAAANAPSRKNRIRHLYRKRRKIAARSGNRRPCLFFPLFNTAKHHG